jgi:hypothetical protein
MLGRSLGEVPASQWFAPTSGHGELGTVVDVGAEADMS